MQPEGAVMKTPKKERRILRRLKVLWRELVALGRSLWQLFRELRSRDAWSPGRTPTDEEVEKAIRESLLRAA